MGVREFLLDRERKAGREEAITGRNYDITKRLILDGTYEDEKIATLVGVSLEFVKALREELQLSA